MSKEKQQKEFIDIFISYCQGDNTPFIPEEDPGWVSDLHETLDTRLNQVRGEPCNIFRDPTLGGVGGTLLESIRTKIGNTSFLLIVVSPLYINSQWCNLEREAFFKKLGIEEGIKRVIRVDKLPVPPPPIPEELEDKYGYRFFEIDSETKKPFEISLRRDKDSARRFQGLINDLAYHIRDVLNYEPLVNKSKDNTVYLAETSTDMQEYRQEIARELLQRRYNILPDKPLSALPSQTSNSVKEHLKQSFLSIHIVGKEYEPLQREEDASVVELQFLEASKFCQNKELETLVWMPEDLESGDEKQNKLIEKIESDKNISDMIINKIEEFKIEINDRIELIKKKHDKDKVIIKPKGISIYLFCNKEDLSEESRGKKTNHITDIKETLYYEGYDVLMPDYLGSESEIKEIHQENLEDCHAILLYFGASNKKWNRDILRELRKHPDFEKNHPLLERCIYVEEDVEPPAIHVATIVQGKVLYSNESLKPFLHSLESKKTL